MSVRLSRRERRSPAASSGESNRIAVVSLVISLLATCVSVLALFLQYREFASERQLVLTGRPCSGDAFIFKQECLTLPPTTAGPSIERLWITWPSVLGEEPVEVTTPTHIPINSRVSDLRVEVERSEPDAAQRGPSDWGYIWDGYVPLVVKTEYVAFNEHHEAVGLYALDFNHVMHTGNPWLKGFRFVRHLSKGETPRGLTDTLWRDKTLTSVLLPR